MGSISHYDSLVCHVVGGTLEAHQGQSFVGKIITEEFLLSNQVDGVSEVFSEERQQGLSVLQTFEGGVGHEESQREALVLIGETFKHCSARLSGKCWQFYVINKGQRSDDLTWHSKKYIYFLCSQPAEHFLSS